MHETTSVFENLYPEDLYVIPSRLMIVLATDWEALSEEDKTLLTKILGSVKQSLSSVQVLVRSEFSIEDLAPFSPERIIAFGASSKDVQRPYEHVRLNNTSLVTADPLNRLDDVKKKNLWAALRQMFGI